jgi:hypothetical protein
MTSDVPPPNGAMLQTLNYALGNLGGRQKSWMQSASTPTAAMPTTHAMSAPAPLVAANLPSAPRPRGRPRKIRAPEPLVEAARPSIEPPADTQPPSNSTSPQLANILTSHDPPHRKPSAVTVFPSPTPSEETMPPGYMPRLRGGDGMASLDFLDVNAPRTVYTPNTPSEMMSRNMMRPGTVSKRPSEEMGEQMGKRRQVGGNAQEQVPRRPLLPQHLEQAHSRSPSISMPSPQQAQAQAQAQAPSLHHRVPSRATGPPPPFPLPPNTAPNPAMMDAASFNHQPDWYTREECLVILGSFRSAHTIASSRPRDGNRLRVLQDATEAQDWSYLVMHQIYCLLDHDAKALPAVLLNQIGLNQAVLMMRNVLDRNSTLSPAALAFFSRYPYTWHQLSVTWPAVLNHQLRTFATFVSLSQNYEPLKLACGKRRFPPLAWELGQYIGVNSPIFQRILFTAILRYLWQGRPAHDGPPRHNYEALALHLFRQNQAEYFQRISFIRQPNPNHISQDNVADLRHWGPQLRQVVEDLEAILHRPSFTAPPLQATDLLHLQQQPFRSRPDPPPALIESDMSRRAHRPAQPNSAQPLSHTPRSRTQAAGPAFALPSQPQEQQKKTSKPLLPPVGWLLSQQRQPNPARFSLHQAHLRSPILKARSVGGSQLYHYLQGYVVDSARLTKANRAVEKWIFQLDAKLARVVAKSLKGAPGEVDRKLVDTTSKTIRLRCIKWPRGAKPPNDHVWASTDTSWIPHSYFTLNDVSLQQRKKIHHGKDLPIDISGLLTEGENVLSISVTAPSTDTSFLDYLVAIEYLGVISHDTVKRDCLKKYRRPAQQVVAELRKKLLGSSEDDDIAIVESNLTINLRDPFSAAKMCDIPVRSKTCLHNDCFDLETFLISRPRKGDVSVSDAWKCPICNADARPDRLIMDGFLDEVKQKLDAQGLSKTRAIVVNQDGTWKPKVEVRDPNSVSDRGVSDEPPSPSVRRPSVPAEIIDISD